MKLPTGPAVDEGNQYRLDTFNAGDAWRLFKIQSEFVDGFDTLSSVIRPAVSIYGSARTKSSDKYYKFALTVSHKLVESGYAIITGGGPGIMEAANKGASEANVEGASIGLNINLPFEQAPNPFADVQMNFKYFFVRKVMFIKYAMAFICMPGGFGTLDELFEALTLIQTKRIKGFPIVLVGSEFWKGGVEWIKESFLKRGTIDKEDLEIFKILDDPDEVVNYIMRRVIL
ncbi:MAG: TIGR00730 family Rossman fold protein [Desulfobulbaceae bacterium]|nr:TIGR00730 family Rossman fold protein [Desulfobulbaceae bacterium]MCK5437318.1 TIGR00730 family Rossman fold protein [Desulfobulbaceae bacterium]